MATNKKITELTELTEVDLADDDVLAIVDISAGITKKVRKSAFTSALAGVSTIAGVSPISVNQPTGAVVVSLVGTIPIANGGTASTDAAAALAALGGMAGPVSATDNAVARFDATTGKLLQNSTVTISDAGAITVGGNVVSDTDSTDDLGTTGVRWANTWTDAINGVTAPTAQYTIAEETKLAGIETAADVTDATNVLLALVGQEVAAMGFTGTLDGVLGGGQPAAATVTTLTASKLVPTGSSVAGNGVYLPAANSVGISTAGAERLRIDASGNVGVGVSPSYKLHVSGDIYATGNITAYSSAAAKADIVTIANPLDLVSKLRGVSFRWKDSGKLAQGLIYEEVAEVIPEVTSNHGGAVGIQYQNLVAVLIESVKALKAEIDELKARY